MARTELLAHGQAIAIDPLGTELARLNVSSHADIRITTANSAFSPAPVTVSIVHEMFPTPRRQTESTSSTNTALTLATTSAAATTCPAQTSY
jgi:hypothetical protein